MLLAVRNTRSAQAQLLDGTKYATNLGIVSRSVDVDGNQELIANFGSTVDMINEHLQAVYDFHVQNDAQQSINGHNGTVPPNGKVLVFCESGNERSAAVVAAYIMSMYSLNTVQSLQVLQGRRFCVCFDDAMKNLLLSYEYILQARRDVAAAAAGSPQVVPEAREVQNGNLVQDSKKGKRTLEETYDDDEMEMGDTADNMDEDRFSHRSGVVPFGDNN
jgi:hypothetical protein